jgi:hypothetical protein
VVATVADTYLPGGRRLGRLRWQPCIIRQVAVVSGGVKRTAPLIWPAGRRTFTERGALRVARREIARRCLPETPVTVTLPGMAGGSRHA